MTHHCCFADVPQEPVLFAGTIFQNVANGLIGTPHVNATYEEKMRLVEEACRAAYAHDFIVDLPEVSTCYGSVLVTLLTFP